MNLTEIRTWAIKMSGRTDLGAVDGTTDTGIDDFLQQGGRYLDRLQPTPNSNRRFVADLATDEYKVNFDLARSVKEVWAADSDGNRWQLERVSHQWLRDEYGTDWADVTGGEPLYYADNIHELATSQQAWLSPATTGMHDVGEITYTPDEGLRSIVIGPPADGLHNVTIFGEFYERGLGETVKAVGDLTLTGLPIADETLTIDDDTYTWKAASGGATEITIGATVAASIDNAVTIINAVDIGATALNVRDNILRVTWDTGNVTGTTFTETMSLATANGSGTLGGTQVGSQVTNNWWSSQLPFALVYAALLHIEIGYRNTQGMQDWITAIDNQMAGVDGMLVEGQLTGNSAMRG